MCICVDGTGFFFYGFTRTGDVDKGTSNGSISVTLSWGEKYEKKRVVIMEKSARPRTALNECVKVVVRCRPLSEKEKNEGYEEVSPL